MEKRCCFNTLKFGAHAAFAECGACGNHVCAAQAKRLNGLCPNCYGKLYPIS